MSNRQNLGEQILKEYILYNILLCLVAFPILFLGEYLSISLFWGDIQFSIPYLLFGLLGYFPRFFLVSTVISIVLAIRAREGREPNHNLGYFITALLGGFLFCIIYGLVLWGFELSNWPKSGQAFMREYEVLIGFVFSYILVRFFMDKWRFR